MADLVRFVDSIVASPTVRLDLNGEATNGWYVRSFSAPAPRLRRSMSSNAMRDGISVGSSSYDARTLTIELECIKNDQDSAATELQKLARELDRESNLIMYRPDGASKPVFFKTFRSDLAQIDDVIAQKAMRRFTIELLAEPFALGLPEALPKVTVSNDPALGSGPISAPVQANLATATTGGTLAAATYYYVVTAVTSSGETTVSNEKSITTTGATSTVTVSWTRVPGATDYRIYRSTSAGTEKLVTSVAPQWTDSSFLDTGYDTDATSPPVSNTAAATGQYIEYASIMGDVEAPLILNFNRPSSGSPMSPAFVIMAARRPGSAGFENAFLQAEGGTMGADTTAAGVDTVMSGSDADNFVRTSFSNTATMANRLTTAQIVNVRHRGACRVIAVVRRSDASSAMRMRAGSTASGVTITGDTVVVPLSTSRMVVDLGLIAPFAGLNEVGYSTVTNGSTASVEIHAARDSGTGTLDIDYVGVLPAFEQMGIFWTPAAVPSSSLWIDGVRDQIGYGPSAGPLGLIDGNFDIEETRAALNLSGGVPRVYPGQTNRLYLLTADSTTISGASCDRLQTWIVKGYYYPRYLYVRPSAS
ncbi:hypothetical protein GCM10011584_09310 [Nocardioides phosphati]|uniref:Uncharacterized protein n=1 Tax=Nocardioides phosphati TaxID=1867775 RepID=A0ABQ2N8F3_9ACTN|nr:hypothetical protein [Nocardioides phosphati]GGO86601.1 hypothetical protein GCM10011584_09310 [Nocardioides phosphati]